MRKTPQTLAAGAFLLESEVNGRPLHLPMLVGRERAVLIDTGCASDVEEVIVPAFQALGLPFESISLVITTHCDFDHQGGNAGIRQRAPNARFLCGQADKRLVESPDLLISERYGSFDSAHGIQYSDDVIAAIRSACGAPCPIDGTLRGGECLEVEPGWELEIVALPGHSAGHIGVLDHRNGTLLGGDAIHGTGYLDRAGRPAMGPTYLFPAPYVASARVIERLAPVRYVSCHWPVLEGDALRSFCGQSRAFVERAEHEILQHLAKHPAGRTLAELCAQIGPRLGDWPANMHIELSYAFHGHLRELVTRGEVRELATMHPFRYQR